jgi:hypothetical protein
MSGTFWCFAIVPSLRSSPNVFRQIVLSQSVLVLVIFNGRGVLHRDLYFFLFGGHRTAAMSVSEPFTSNSDTKTENLFRLRKEKSDFLFLNSKNFLCF